jgi:aspartyl-tRNA(Asn)/glutamyl-tRNA(Gln) amidotransferase subunit B
LQAPIIVGGYVEIEVDDGQKKKINLNRAQLEADAGKNTHPEGADYSLVDLNRVGTPLLEIVSEPEIHSAVEAKAYVRELYLLMKYAGVSDVDLYHGNMRFDVNVSVSKDPNELGKRTETKNLNSFRSVENAILYEIDRQIELLEKGEKIVQETRGWNEAKQKTTSQRSKEEAQDYRYMPEPDIPPVELEDEYIKKMKSRLPKMPSDIREELQNSGLDNAQIEIILDDNELAEVYIEAIEKSQSREVAKTWSQGVTNNKKIRDAMLRLTTDLKEQMLKNSLAAAAATVSNDINSNQFNQSLEEIVFNHKAFEELSFSQISDEGEIEKIVEEVLAENEKAAEDVKNGEMKAIGFLVGQVMKKSQGKANPQMAQGLIKKQLGTL